MPYYKDLKFIHITKCAGTFIEDIGLDNGYNWGRHHKEYGWWHDIFKKKAKELRDKYDWFVVVRNPYNRILSEYYCQWGGIGKKNLLHTKDEFNNFLIRKIQKKSDSIGHHYTEQYKYIDNESKITIIKFENLTKELNDLFKLYNINIDTNNYKKTNTKEEKNNNKLLFTIKDFSKELISLINNVYKKDFELFGYEIKTDI